MTDFYVQENEWKESFFSTKKTKKSWVLGVCVCRYVFGFFNHHNCGSLLDCIIGRIIWPPHKMLPVIRFLCSHDAPFAALFLTKGEERHEPAMTKQGMTGVNSSLSVSLSLPLSPSVSLCVTGGSALHPDEGAMCWNVGSFHYIKHERAEECVTAHPPPLLPPIFNKLSGCVMWCFSSCSLDSVNECHPNLHLIIWLVSHVIIAHVHKAYLIFWDT